MTAFFAALMATPLVGTILRLSLLGSLLAVVLLLIRPLLRGRVSHAFTYYLWIFVLLRLCLPVGITIPLPENQNAFQRAATINPAIAQNNVAMSPGEEDPLDFLFYFPEESAQSHSFQGRVNPPVFWITLWGTGFLLSLGRYLYSYLRFSWKVRQSLREPSTVAQKVLQQLGPVSRVRLAVCPLVDTPVLMGVIHPTILLLPSLEENYLQDILTHELTHARRWDLLYKWFAVTVTCLHWFNPLMFLILREINRLCELSCDEAVTARMNLKERCHYGETLLALAAAPPKLGLLTTTLCEEGNRLRERLVSLARPRQRTTATFLLSCLIALITGGCALISDTGPHSVEIPSTSDFHSVSLVFQEVFQGERDVLLVEPNGAVSTISINEVPGYFSSENDSVAIWYFTVVDLDQNGENELVLQVIGSAGDIGGFLTLHRMGEDICGFPQNYRCFENLKTDGSFDFSSGMGGDSGVGRIWFRAEDGVRESGIEPLFWRQLNTETGEETFILDNQETTAEKYNQAMDLQCQKDETVWYDFTPEGINRAFADS